MTQQQLFERQKWFVNLRFGQFIHFSSGTVQFADSPVKDWEDAHENCNQPRQYPFDPKDWNPAQLDCDQWAAASAAMGASFGCLTAKHHEGFCLWPTETTPHSVASATNKTDVVAAYLEAYRKAGLAAGLYFSTLDLTHKIGRKKCTPEDVEFTKQQLKELLTRYGEIPFLVIDGWNAPWGGPVYEKLPFEELDAFVKSIQPECLILNHCCETSLAHTDVVFYENAAGQEVEDGFVGPGAAGNILTNKNWFWRRGDDSAKLKSADWALQKIKEMNEKNVAFFLNASPNPQGLIDENMVARFREIGARYQKPAPLEELPAGWLMR